MTRRTPTQAATLLAMILGAVAAPVVAQETTGSIWGIATDPDGVPLPGVAVTVDSSEVPAATAFTQANGVYRFPLLPPGDDYQLTFALDGFGTIVQTEVPVRLGAAQQIDMRMQPAAVAETITVVGETPLVDVKKTGTARNFTEQQMQSIPSARDPWVLLQQTPGFQVSRENVGGSESGQQSGFIATGNRGSDAMWTYDGAEINDMGTPGGSPLYYDFDAFEEISVSYGGNDVSMQTGGVRINFVTKRGGDTWRGTGRFYLTDSGLAALNVGDPETGALVGSYTADELFPGYVGNSIDGIKDWGAEIGGSLVPDRAFVWAAYGKQDIKHFVGTQPDNTQLTNVHAKGNLHLGDKSVLNLTWVRSDKTKQGRFAAAFRTPAATADQGAIDPGVYTAKLQRTFGDDHYVEASLNRTNLGFFLEPNGGRDTQVSIDRITGIWDGSLFWWESRSSNTNVRVDGNSYLAGVDVDHELKYGYSFRNSETSTMTNWSAGVRRILRAGVPTFAVLSHDIVFADAVTRHSLYLGDTVSAGRLTVTGGVRYDRQASTTRPTSVGAHSLVPEVMPAQTYPGNDTGHAWSALSPRLGLTFDLSRDGRTIVRANAARYYAQMGSKEFQYDVTTFGPTMNFLWNDANGDRILQADELVGDPLFVSAGFDPANPNAPSPNRFTPTSAPYSDELILGVEHEIDRTFSLGADFTYRNNTRETWSIRPGEDDPSFWCAASREIDGTAVSYFEPCGPRAGFTVYDNRPGYSRRYKGVTAYLNKRFANGWMGNASFTWADPTEHFEVGGYTDPTNVRFQDGAASAPLDMLGGASAGAARWYLKASGMAQLPRGFSLAGFLQAREGHILVDHYRIDNRANGGGNVDAYTAPVGSQRLPTFWNLDLRLEKTLDLGGRGRVHLIADAFNVFNNDAVLGRSERINSNHGRITNVLVGRTIRLGLRLILR